MVLFGPPIKIPYSPFFIHLNPLLPFPNSVLPPFVPFRATTSEIVFDRATGLLWRKGSQWRTEKELVEGQQWQGVTDGSCRGKKRTQMTSTGMKAATSLARPRGFPLLAALGLRVASGRAEREVLSWSDQLSFRRKGKDALTMGGFEQTPGGCQDSA